MKIATLAQGLVKLKTVRAETSVNVESLDFLRGVAALGVVVNHARGLFFQGGVAVLHKYGSIAHVPLFDKLGLAFVRGTSFGVEFVTLFFVLSGFAMAHSIRTSAGVGSFYVKRVIRIWPTYLAGVALAVVTCLLLAHAAKPAALIQGCAKLCSVSGLTAMVFYVDTDTYLTPQFWSLPFEVLFYFLAPVILKSLERVLATLAFAVVSTIVFASVFGIWINVIHSLPLNFLGTELLFFAIGATAYYVSPHLPAVPGWVALVVFPIGLEFALVVKFVLGGFQFAAMDGANIPSSLIMVALTLMAIQASPSISKLPKVLNIGRFSYSLYVFHYQLLVLLAFGVIAPLALGPALWSSYVGWLVFVPIVVGVCWLLYLVTEKPCNAYLAAIRRREKAKRAGAPLAAPGTEGPAGQAAPELGSQGLP